MCLHCILKLSSKQGWICWLFRWLDMFGQMTLRTDAWWEVWQSLILMFWALWIIHQKACLLFLWSSHTCWGVCWTEMQNFAEIGISFVIFYCTAVSGRKAKYVAHPLMKINACSWISISLLSLQVIALQIGWEFFIPLRKGKGAQVFHRI